MGIDHFKTFDKTLTNQDKAGKCVNLVRKCVDLANQFAKSQKDGP